MKVIAPGHQYDLHTQDGKSVAGTLQFMQRKGVVKGTTTEDVLAVLIDRIEFLQTKVPCKENKAALVALGKAKAALEARTADRVARGVKGLDRI